MVEYSESECQLGKLAVGHHHFRLIASFGRTHAREVDAVAGLPVMFAEIAQMTCHHRHVGAPVLKAYEHSHAYLVHSGLTHAVKSVDTPFENGFHAVGMIGLVGLLMICLLKAHHTVQPAACQPLIVAGLHWHHLDGEVAEIWPCHLQHLLEIVHAVEPRELSRHHQQILKRAEAPDSLTLFLHLIE